MYAIISIGGKQYKVSKNDAFKTEKINASIGKKINAETLLVSDEKSIDVGTPALDKKKASLEVVSHGKDEKVDVVKFKAKKRYTKKIGHRQSYTILKFLGFEEDTKKSAPKKAARAKETKAKTTTTKKAAPKTAVKKTTATTKKAAPKTTAKKATATTKKVAPKTTTKKATTKAPTKKTTSTTKK